MSSFNIMEPFSDFIEYKGRRHISSNICHPLIFHFRYFEKKEHEILYISVYFFYFLLNTKAHFQRTNSLGDIPLLDLPNNPKIFSFANLA